MTVKYVDNIWKELESYTIYDDFLIITDRNVYNLYEENISQLIGKKDNIYILKPGEESKSLEDLTKIYKKLIDKAITRKGTILSLGGGVVGDLAGFAAATYKRGISY